MLGGADRASAAGAGAGAKVGGSHKGVAMSVYDIEEEEAGLEVEEEELSEGEAEILEMALREVCDRCVCVHVDLLGLFTWVPACLLA